MSLHPAIRYHEHYRIRTYEIDSSKKITIPALVTLMQETAMQQVIRLNVSLWDLEALNMSWVMMRMQLKVMRLPQLGETLKVTTVPAGFEKFFSYRDYLVHDEAGALVATASSNWLMMDTEKRKMTRIPDFILAIELPDDEPFLPRPINKLPPLTTPFVKEKRFDVNWHDLDFNGHLSNISYMKWMIETMDDVFLEKGRLAQFDLFFRSEALWKEKIIGAVQQIDETTFRHQLIRKSDKKELAASQSRWILN